MKIVFKGVELLVLTKKNWVFSISILSLSFKQLSKSKSFTAFHHLKKFLFNIVVNLITSVSTSPGMERASLDSAARSPDYTHISTCTTATPSEDVQYLSSVNLVREVTNGYPPGAAPLHHRFVVFAKNFPFLSNKSSKKCQY